MRLKKIPSVAVFLLVCGALSAAGSTDQAASVQVNESATRLTFSRGRAFLSLALVAPAGLAVRADVSVEVAAPDNRVVARAASTISLVGTLQRVMLPLSWKLSSGIADAATHRIRYRIAPFSAKGAALPTVEGIFSASAIAPQLFELRLMGLQYATPGGPYVAEIQAKRFGSGRPAAGVQLEAWIGDEEDGKGSLRAHGQTDARGQARLAFRLPANIPDNEAEIEVRGRLGDVQNSVSGTIHIFSRASIFLTTDKPLYQPGQTLHLRALVTGGAGHAWANQSIRFKALDPDDSLVFAADAKTSRFGVAFADWQIPPNLRLGTYRLRADVLFVDSEPDSELARAVEVRISRYELPAFSVDVHPDRPYYLAGQKAGVTVSGAYLFGKPVLRGHVRVVRESSRRWNFREQKWDIDEGESQEGDLDAEGRFRVTLNLSADSEEIRRNQYERFLDVRFAAYLTDASSGRTEQRRFDIRVTRDPIHLYVIRPGWSVPRGLPLEFYVTASFADGTPAECDLRVHIYAGERRAYGNIHNSHTQLGTLTGRTNPYGVAKFATSRPLNIPPNEDELSLSVEATARDGRSGNHAESLWTNEHPAVRIRTQKTIFNTGDPIEVLLDSTVHNGQIRVAAVGESRILFSQDVRLSRGRASLVIPGDVSFHGVVTLIARFVDLSDAEEAEPGRTAWRSIVFPQPSDLHLDVRFSKPSYRPGETAEARLRVLGATGSGEESALGLLVFDRAVEELSRSQDESRGDIGFSDAWSRETSSETLAGVSRRDLERLDLSKRLPPGLDLVAETLLADVGGAYSYLAEDSDTAVDFVRVFRSELSASLDPVRKALDDQYGASRQYPRGEPALGQALPTRGIVLDRQLDPWQMPFYPRWSVAQRNDVLEFVSRGPDKKRGTADDFAALRIERPYFLPYEEAIRRALGNYHERTGGYIRDLAILRDELRRIGVDLDSLRDPWDTPYRYEFGVYRDKYTASVRSAGPDRRFGEAEDYDGHDDFTLAIVSTPYFDLARSQIGFALDRYAKARLKFPGDWTEFREALREGGVDWDTIRDGWGRPYDALFHLEPAYADRITMRSYEDVNRPRTEVTPVTRFQRTVRLFSRGPDGLANTPDDFEVASFVSPISEETLRESPADASRPPQVFSGGAGAIHVTAADPAGAVVPRANVKATAQDESELREEYACSTAADGACFLRNLPSGFYIVRVSAFGFRDYVVTHVPVRSSTVTSLRVVLSLGVLAQTVTVEAAAVEVQTAASSLRVAGRQSVASLPLLLSTPRLRQYFPETLFWQPEVITDRRGKASVAIPLADNITTWKLSVIASTVDGRVVTAEKDVRAFQPFFAELDPPSVLTVGDEISLPVALRNYLDESQTVTLEWSRAEWSELLSSSTVQAEIPAGDFVRKVFSFRAAAPAREARQRVTAFNRTTRGEGDALEKKVRVNPDGEQRFAQATAVFSESASLELDIPRNAISGSIEAELVVYPNLLSHVADSIEAILRRPYGCAEQTISSSYPSLLWLRLAKAQRLPRSALDDRAHRYLSLGYLKLLGYRSTGGGFTYWGRGDADAALTAYALRFLADAKEFIDVDEATLEETRAWLLKQAAPDGSWPAKDYKGQVDETRTLHQTAYVVRTLAADLSLRSPSEKGVESERSALSRAVAYLGSAVVGSNDAYPLALFTLAQLALDDAQSAGPALQRLASLAHPEGDLSYWALESNTVFYGWGRAGRIETSALAVEALALARARGIAPVRAEDLLSRGILFLLRNRDAYGVWYSTQATVNVLGALLAGLADAVPVASASADPGQIFVDGRPGPALPRLEPGVFWSPLRVDLSSLLPPGSHRVEVRRPSGSRASVQLVAAFFTPWEHRSVQLATARSGDSESLRYSVVFDRTSASEGDPVRCTVHAERVGFRGYGMMLAEVGLPPGADVDHSTLQAAMEHSGWEIQQYEVRPDRVVVYLWPRAGGTTFAFLFRTRFGMKAQSPESVLYDYYNPDARASVPPSRFVVQ